MESETKHEMKLDKKHEMKPDKKLTIKKGLLNFALCLPLIFLVIWAGVECYDEYIIRTKELVLDPCIVRGISYDGRKTLLVVELPDHELAIVDATVYHSRALSDRPNVMPGDLIRCRWKNGDTSELGYSSRQKGDLHY